MWRLITTIIIAAGSIVAAMSGSSLFAAGGTGNEIVNYTYDAKGRLLQVRHSGTVNTNVSSNYSFDKTDNRVNVNVTGAP